MSLSTPSRRRWTESTIESELRGQLAELGHFPTRAELVARGLRGLWDAMMRTAGGVETWQERLQERPSQEATASQPTPSPGIAAGDGQTRAVDGTASGQRDVESPNSAPTASREDIAARAYEIYESGAVGDSTAHWLEAEQQLGA